MIFHIANVPVQSIKIRGQKFTFRTSLSLQMYNAMRNLSSTVRWYACSYKLVKYLSTM